MKMKYIRIVVQWSIVILVSVLLVTSRHWQVNAAELALIEGNITPEPTLSPSEALAQLDSDLSLSVPTADPFVQLSSRRQIRALRSVILASAERHNRPELSGMSDTQFAEMITLLLYSEQVGWLDSAIAPLRPFSPIYQQVQVQVNEVGGANLSVLPANLRPSVALEILKGQVPVPAPTDVITVSLKVVGSQIKLNDYSNQSELYMALSREISNPELAVEYLATNLERGVYRARFEGAPIAWQTLAAWHNQGVVTPLDIRQNSTVVSYIRRTAAYRDMATALIAGKPYGHNRIDEELEEATSIRWLIPLGRVRIQPRSGPR